MRINAINMGSLVLVIMGVMMTGSGCSSSSPAVTEPDSGGGGGGACSGGAPVSLTVMNFKNWCSVSVAGGADSTNATETVCVAAGTVKLDAKPASSTFELGSAPWTGTSGDKGSGDPGTMTGSGASAESATTVDVTSGSACVAVCCPFSSPAGTGCPTTKQCP
jgi:hypothetical protein